MKSCGIYQIYCKKLKISRKHGFLRFHVIWGVEDPSKPSIILRKYWCFQPGAASGPQKHKNVDFSVILPNLLDFSIFQRNLQHFNEIMWFSTSWCPRGPETPKFALYYKGFLKVQITLKSSRIAFFIKIYGIHKFEWNSLFSRGFHDFRKTLAFVPACKNSNDSYGFP